MNITIDLDRDEVDVLNRHLNMMELYKKIGVSDTHPTDAILKKIQEALLED